MVIKKETLLNELTKRLDKVDYKRNDRYPECHETAFIFLSGKYEGLMEAINIVKDQFNVGNITTTPKESLANIIREIATKAAYKELYGEEMENIARVDLTKVPTCELSKELEKREGIEVIKLAPYEKMITEVEGPMTVLKNID